MELEFRILSTVTNQVTETFNTCGFKVNLKENVFSGEILG